MKRTKFYDVSFFAPNLLHCSWAHSAHWQYKSWLKMVEKSNFGCHKKHSPATAKHLELNIKNREILPLVHLTFENSPTICVGITRSMKGKSCLDPFCVLYFHIKVQREYLQRAQRARYYASNARKQTMTLFICCVLLLHFLEAKLVIIQIWKINTHLLFCTHY